MTGEDRADGWRARLRRVGVAAVASALVLELGARWFLAGPARLAWVASPLDEPSWRLGWVLRHDADGVMRYAFDVPHPLRGWAVRPDLRGVRAFGDASLSTNSRGARGDREYAVPKPAGTVRILVFGDSFTFGEEVGDDQTYAHQLETLLPETEVVNLGVHGYGHDQMLLYLHEAADYAPDVVLLGYVTDDALRNLLAFRDYAKPRFALTAGGLVLEGTPVPAPDAVLRREPWRSKLVDLATMASERLAWRFGSRQQAMHALTVAILDAFFADVRRLHARPVVADLPVWGELDDLDPAPSAREALLAGLCRERDVPYVALRPLFVARRRSGVEIGSARHWRPLEHRIAAEGIAAFLRRSGLIPATGGSRPELQRQGGAAVDVE